MYRFRTLCKGSKICILNHLILFVRGNEMATKNRIAYALPIIQTMWILPAKSHKQMRLRLIYRERVGIISRVAHRINTGVLKGEMSS